MAVDQPDHVGVRINGQPAASLVVENGLVIYVPEEGSIIDYITSDNPVRMDVADANPVDTEAVLISLDETGRASFVTDDGVNYFIVGFEKLPVILDVSKLSDAACCEWAGHRW